MKISEIITDKYKLRIPPTIYYELLADVVEAEEEQEPNIKNDLGVDCISRAEAIKCLECDFDITGKENMKTVVNYINSAHDKIVNLPRVKQEPTTKNDLGVDCISRADALDCVNWGYSLSDVYKKISDLPSVTPQEPTDNDVVLTYDMYHDLIADRAEKLEQEPILDELRAEITTLQNRCYSLTKGTMCMFCKYECEYKADRSKEDGNDD